MRTLLALLLAATLLAAPGRAEAAGVLTVSPGNAVAREPVTVTASVPGRVRRPAVLQRRSGSGWVTVTRRATTSTGRVAFRFAARAMVVRVVAPRTRVQGRTYAAWTSSSKRIEVRVPRSSVVGRAGTGPRVGRTSEFGAEGASISASGRYVAFSSYSSDVVAGDGNGHSDVFVHDTRTGDVRMVSFRNAVGDANGDSFDPVVSADGGHVAFTSAASNLVLDTNAALDVFVWDRTSGDVERVSVATGGGEVDNDSYDPSIAEYGNVVVFTSKATDLLAGDANAASDVFVRARGADRTTLVSRRSDGMPANDVSNEPSVSRDGKWVAFSTLARDIVSGDTNSRYDVIRRPLFTAGAPVRIGRGNGGSSAPSISGNGGRVAFVSSATNLVRGDDNRRLDVFVWDSRTRKQSLVSAARDRTVGADASSNAAISADGRFVSFESYAGDLAPGDANGILDVFVRNLGAGVTSAVSAFEDGSTPAQESRNASISANGDHVAFESAVSAYTFDDDNFYDDVFVCRRRSLGSQS